MTSSRRRDERWLQALLSADPDRQLGVLHEIKRSDQDRPSDQVIRAVIELCNSSDDDVQFHAIGAASVYWPTVEACQPLLNIVRNLDKYSSTVSWGAMHGLGVIASVYPECSKEVIAALLPIAVNPQYDDELRGVAYNGARSAAGFPPVENNEGLPDDIKDKRVDWIWIKKMLDG